MYVENSFKISSAVAVFAPAGFSRNSETKMMKRSQNVEMPVSFNSPLNKLTFVGSIQEYIFGDFRAGSSAIMVSI